MTRYLTLLALLTTVACGETRVPEQRCVDWCARKVLSSYDEGAPLSADTLREWIAYCERSRGPCCDDNSTGPHRCSVDWERP